MISCRGRPNILVSTSCYQRAIITERYILTITDLFNNPVDRQPVMTLAQNMYPENLQYLLVDLKPTTSEHLRMRIDVLDPTKQQVSVNLPHSPTDISTTGI